VLLRIGAPTSVQGLSPPALEVAGLELRDAIRAAVPGLKPLLSLGRRARGQH
jgi:hypothetical protein